MRLKADGGMLVDDPNDGYDILEWIGNQPWCNGKVGTFGTSYVGGTQHALACSPASLSELHDSRGLRVQCWYRRHSSQRGV